MSLEISYHVQGSKPNVAKHGKLEFSEYDKIQEDSADLHVVTSLSPLKKSRAAGSQYYDG